MKLNITIDRKAIGHIMFNVVDPDTATINITDVYLPDHAKLRKELIRHLTKNPDRISRMAARTPKNIGDSGDGLLAVLRHIQPKYGFEFEKEHIPLPRLEPGLVY